MKGRAARRKGHNYERKIRQEFIKLGYVDCNTSRYESKMLDDQKVDLTNTGIYNVQCKAVERGVNYHALLSEMPKDKKVNVVFHKKNRQETVTMSKKDFYRILSTAKN